MAATAWAFYNSFKRELGLGNIPLDGTGVQFQMRLFQSASNAATATLSAIGSVTNEVVNNANYGARSLTVNWSVRTTTSSFSWTWNTVIWTAGASAISNIRYAVIYMQTASTLVCWSALSTAEFNVADGNTYAIEPNPVCFELVSS